MGREKKETEKTNVMRILTQYGIVYDSYHYETKVPLSGTDMAKVLRIDENRMFKTLVTVGHNREHYVFVIPVNRELNLKKAASAVQEKSIEMIPQKELLPLTGYVHGGCSPIGMKKLFRTVVDERAASLERFVFSAGKIGYQVEITIDDLQKVIPIELKDLCS